MLIQTRCESSGPHTGARANAFAHTSPDGLRLPSSSTLCRPIFRSAVRRVIKLRQQSGGYFCGSRNKQARSDFHLPEGSVAADSPRQVVERVDNADGELIFRALWLSQEEQDVEIGNADRAQWHSRGPTADRLVTAKRPGAAPPAILPLAC